MWGITGYTGTSISSMTELAIIKQYSLLANVHCNAIFVRREYLNLFHDREVTPDEVFTMRVTVLVNYLFMNEKSWMEKTHRKNISTRMLSAFLSIPKMAHSHFLE